MKLLIFTRSIFLKEWLYLLVSTLFLMVAAFYNGFPLVNPDSGTYISSGLMLQPPSDRPITYGMLIRLFSINGLNLWPVIFVQSFTMGWLINEIIKEQLNTNYKPWFSLIIIAPLSLLSSLSWISSELIADVYTSMGFLALIALLQLPKGSKKRTLLFVIYFFAIATHLSHLLIFVLLIVLLYFIAKYFYNSETLIQIRKNLFISLLLSLASLIIVSNSSSRSGHVFIMASFLEKGVLKEYLDEKCPTTNYALCKYKNNMLVDANYFLWNTGSPLLIEGGNVKVKDEYTKIISGIISSPKLVYHFIKQSIDFCYRQSYNFKIGDGNTPLGEDCYIQYVMFTYFQNQYSAYINSVQNKDHLMPAIEKANFVFKNVIIFSLALLIIMLLLFRKKLSKSAYFLCFSSTALIIINIVDCATFAQVNGRYGCRVIWLIPFLFFIVLLSLLKSSRKKVTNE